MAVAAFVVLALSRRRESEADYIGQLLMADAGFDPSASAAMCTKLNEVEEKQMIAIQNTHKEFRRVPEFRFTHPHVIFSVSTIRCSSKSIFEIVRIKDYSMRKASTRVSYDSGQVDTSS